VAVTLNSASAAVIYSALNGTSVAPTYPGSLTSTKAIIMIIGMKPSTANSGSVTTPSGWTLRGSLTGAGGYGTTLGADTGNTNLWIYSKDTVTGSETGSLTVTVATNNVCWGYMMALSGTGSYTYNSTTGSDTAAGNISVTYAADPGFNQGDFGIIAWCQPTDVTTPSQFTSPNLTVPGVTLTTATIRQVEPDSGTGNDIGGLIAYQSIDGTGSSNGTAPSFTATAGGTTTNVRGPSVLLRVREVAVAGLTKFQQNQSTNQTLWQASSVRSSRW
jgi:hypothetical protein